MRNIFFLEIFVLLIFSCENANEPSGIKKNLSAASIGFLGNTENINTDTEAGILLMGGGKDVDQAILWLIEKAEGGDIKIIRATGTNAYNVYIYDLDQVNSVETLLIDSKEKANDTDVNKSLAEAEAIFIAGGNQADYIELWKNTALI